MGFIGIEFHLTVTPTFHHPNVTPLKTTEPKELKEVYSQGYDRGFGDGFLAGVQDGYGQGYDDATKIAIKERWT